MVRPRALDQWYSSHWTSQGGFSCLASVDPFDAGFTSRGEARPPAQDPSPNLRFGMPAPAKADPESSREAFLISRPQYVLSYNAKTRIANWVFWRLRKLSPFTLPLYLMVILLPMNSPEAARP